jgi:CO dehydrogenase maturation factor
MDLADDQVTAGARVVLCGKGGVGKTTIAALISLTLARAGRSVVALDADEQRNLGATLGIDPGVLARAVPVASNEEYVLEKTGARPGEGAGGMLRLNPPTDDVVDRLSLAGPEGVRFLMMGGVRGAGAGCLCPEHAVVTAVISQMRLRQGDVVVMDTHAGVEHFGRALARGFDTALVVVDPTFNAVQVGLETARLARDLGIGAVHLVVNRARDAGDLGRVGRAVERLGGFEFTSVLVLPYDDRVLEVEPSVAGLFEGSSFADAVASLARTLWPLPAPRAAAQVAR